MSTKKIRDVTSRQSTTTKTTKAKKTLETPKKEAPKTKTSSRILKKVNEDDDDKLKKKIIKAPISQSSKKESRPAPVKRVTSTAKPPSSRPVTPPSSRVSKTQFFPSKKMYSNALKREPSRKILKPENHLRHDPPPTNIKVNTLNDVSPDSSSMSERPRTATLRKGSIVNKNIVGPEAPKAKIKLPVTPKVEEPQLEYEEDFDSYESDFDEYNSSESATDRSSGTTSSDSTETESEELQSAPKRVSSAGTDDEKKLDSGNYELPEARHRQILDNIKEAIEKENANLNLEHNRSHLGSLSDEGFEDGKSLQFINFLGAQKKYQHRKSIEMRRKRGEEIMSMIRLDHYSFTLYDLAPVPYDVFIKSFGKSNTVQASVQTGQDDLNEEVQTEPIAYSNKWTQCPPCFTKLEETQDFWGQYKCNYLGVGGDVVEQHPEKSFNESNLERFLLNTGNLILNLQAETNVQVNAQMNKSNIPFSKSCIRFDTRAQEILKNRHLNDVCFCSSNSKILTVHGTRTEDSFGKSVVCLWSTSNVETPDLLLFAFGEVTSCAFSSECPNLIFGGLDSGSIVIWDTKETSSCHKNVYHDDDDSTRSPTYSTEINYGHCYKIISIQSMTHTSNENGLFFHQKATEVCSLDEDGEIIVWSVIFKEKSQGRVLENQGMAHWGSVILTINTKISLKRSYPEIEDFKCTDLTLSHFDSSNLYISTSYGIIIHCLANGGKTSVKKFQPDTQSQANCLEMCPFSSEYLIAGFDNGDINFYSRVIEKPLMVLSNKDALEGKSKIQRIQWSHNRPLIFYTKDVSSTIHVWNLKVSDMFPVYSIPFKENIVCMRLSPIITNNDGAPENTYMMIATDDGLVYIHLLSEEHDQQNSENFEKDKRKFMNYINRYL